MRLLLMRAAVFAAVFFCAGLVMQRGDPCRVLILTVVATGLYVGLVAVLAWVGRRPRHPDG